MSSSLLSKLKTIEECRRVSIDSLNNMGVETPTGASFATIANNISKVNVSDSQASDFYKKATHWERPSYWPAIDEICDSSEEITIGNITYVPTYAMLYNDINDSNDFKKSDNSNSRTYGDAYLFSDSTELVVGDNTHTWDKSKDIAGEEGYNMRYVVVYNDKTKIPNKSSQAIRLVGIKNNIIWIYMGKNAKVFPYFGYDYVYSSSKFTLVYASGHDEYRPDSIPSNALRYCRTLKKVKFNGITTIDIPQFLSDCNSLVEVEMKSLTEVYTGFIGGNSIAYLDLPSLVSAGSYFLSSCGSLVSVNLPNLQTCGDDSIYHCSSLVELNLPKLTNAGTQFCMGNTLMRRAILPLLKTYMVQSFNDCFSLKSLTINAGYTDFSIDNLSNDYSLSELNIPDGFSSSLNITDMPLNHTSIMKIINALGSVSSRTLTMGADKLAMLTDEEKKIATDKGWTLA